MLNGSAEVLIHYVEIGTKHKKQKSPVTFSYSTTPFFNSFCFLAIKDFRVLHSHVYYEREQTRCAANFVIRVHHPRSVTTESPEAISSGEAT